jgi:hypothetical protein
MEHSCGVNDGRYPNRDAGPMNDPAGKEQRPAGRGRSISAFLFCLFARDLGWQNLHFCWLTGKEDRL